MKDVALHIEYLLTQHDCVVVPGWGALVVQHSNARIDDKGYIVPPCRWLSFNALLVHNDGLLAHSVMRGEGCSYEDAMSYIERSVSLWRSEAEAGKSVVWQHIGAFVPQRDGTMLFVESPDTVVNASLSILQTIELPTLSEIISIEEEVAEEEVAKPVVITWHRRAMQAVASIAAIVVFMLFISTPVDNFEPANDYAGLVSYELMSNETAVIEANEEFVAEPIVELSLVEIESEEVVPVAEVEAQEVDAMPDEDIADVAIEVVAEQEVPRYILVVGSLPSRSLAEKQIAEFAQMGVTDAIGIYEKDGRYRLYIDGSQSMAQAQQRLAEINSQPNTPFAGVWICATR